MKATELRIGNFVQDKKYKRAWRINHFLGVQVVEVDHWMFEYETDDCHEPNIYDLEPIPLTEEWLVKFGFEKMDAFGWVKDFITLDESVAHYSFDMWRGTYSIEKCDMTEIPQEIKYVHQIQNLYFALTGQELQTDETKKKVNL